MKKLFWLTLITSLLFIVITLVRHSNCPPPTAEPTTTAVTETTTSPDVGGWSEDRDVTEEDLEVFVEAMMGIVGAIYDEPTLVATQVVAGTNYRFTTTATTVYPGAVPYGVYVYIFKPLDGPAELVDIERVD